MVPPLRFISIGAGQRGADVYGEYARQHPDQIRIMAVAEPIRERRQRFTDRYDLGDDQTFAAWEDLLERPPVADAAIIATQDQDHVAPTLAALRAGYNVLLEKPMATTLDGCVSLVKAAEETGLVLQICHVLRYTPFFWTLHDLVQSGRLGDVITVEHRENVAYYHMAHSYVRGNWRRKDETSPMILAKCCHDLDLLYWIMGQPFTRLSSIGSLKHFRPENAPHPDVPLRCTDGCPVEAECPFSAPAIYLEQRPWGGETRADSWPMSVLAHGDTSRPALVKALHEGPYGRCVYHCDNDVVDHQVVAMQAENGASVTLFMHGHSHEEGRTMRYDGTRATLFGNFTHHYFEIHDHLTGQCERIETPAFAGAHGGGDERMMAEFVRLLRGGERIPLTGARESLESHLLAFAAEQARVEGSVIDMAAFRRAALD
jgi:predicted dehydrogenase